MRFAELWLFIFIVVEDLFIFDEDMLFRIDYISNGYWFML